MVPTTFRSLAVSNPDDLMFGRAPRPVACGTGLVIGGGAVYPEINFTLPPMLIEPGTWAAVRQIYEQTMDSLLERARRLGLAGLVVEFEQLPPMTANPGWGAELVEVIKSRLVQAHETWGLKGAIRNTIIDLREEVKPPPRRRGSSWDAMRASLEQGCQRGSDILAIESTGGKEVHDVALTHADMPGIMLALGVLAPADMAWLWDQFVGIAAEHPGVVAGGDSACGFANTAMQLAEKRMLPEVLAALDRVLTCVRALVAFERGALGPSKDCAYEGPVMKAVAGVPISMEGRSATCAHLSPVGNIAAAVTDLWSNESVSDIRLLSGQAPVASLESLIYDCRLMNAALDGGSERVLRDLHVRSDATASPQAYVLTPDATLRIGRAIVVETDPYQRTLAAARVAFEILAEGTQNGALRLDAREQRWLDKFRKAADALPPTADALVAATKPRYGELYDPASYGL
jgi:methanol--5-hydroxybenzimidazolylcobamide Co-methyltransferase